MDVACLVQWRKPGPQFGGTRKIFAVPQIQNFLGGKGGEKLTVSWNYTTKYAL